MSSKPLQLPVWLLPINYNFIWAPFTLQMWKYLCATAKWENVWRKTREFQVVRNSCSNQWHFPHARAVTWYKETSICKWTCCSCILRMRNHLYSIVFFNLDFLHLLQGLQGYKRSCFPPKCYLLIGELPFRAFSQNHLNKNPSFQPSDPLSFLISSFSVLFHTYLTTALTTPLEQFPLTIHCNLLPILNINIYESLWRINWYCFQYCRSYMNLNLLKYLNNTYNKSQWPPCLQDINCQYRACSQSYD